MDQRIKYIYILSQRYSGSTLLSFLMGTHPEIATIGERRKFFVHSLADEQSNMKCSCGKLFAECEHWNNIKQSFLSKYGNARVKKNFTEFEIFRNKYLNRIAFQLHEFCKLWNIHASPFSGQVSKLNELNRTLIEEILSIENKSVFLDSSKTINHLLFLSQIKQFDLKVIWLTRDPRAQINSALKYNDFSISKATRLWIQEMKHNALVLDKLNIEYKSLAYESLCANPDDEMIDILEFCGLSPEKYSLQFRKEPLHIMGNYNMRLGDDEKIEERREWKESLSSSDIQYIERHTRQYASHYSIN